MRKGLLRTICSLSLIAAIFTTMSINASPILVGINDAALNVKNVTDATRVSSPVNHPSASKKSIKLPLSENKATANSVASAFLEGNEVKTGGEPVKAPLLCITTNTVVYTFNTGTAVNTFTIPANAASLVTIRAVGASGGNAGGGAKGGRGADIQGDFALSPGTVLYIMAGNVGSNTISSLRGGGGGGGSFVTTDPAFTSGLLLAAGGGGGAANASFGSDGRIPIDTLLPSTTYYNAGYAGGIGATANGGDGGFLGTGGSAAADVNAGAAGAGWNSDGSGLGAGGNANTGGIPPYLSTTSTASGVPTGGGGTSAKGGFGGGANGGNGTAPFNGGGGGGGYSGGGAGGRATASSGTYGGGGGSYNGGTNQVNKKGSDPTSISNVPGAGKVYIYYYIYNPDAPFTSGNQSRCGTGTLTLSAVATECTGLEAIDWYDAPTGGNLLASGSPLFTTPILNTTTTYYAASRNIQYGISSTTRTAVTATVNPIPSVSITPSATTINAGDNVTLTASGATSYTWTGTNGFSGSGASVTDSPTSTTTYTVSGTENGCVNTSTVTITVNSLFTPATALDFDGVDDYVSINNPFTAFNNELTVEFWMKAPSANLPYGSIIGQGTSGVDLMSDNVWLMHPNTDGTLTFYVNDGGNWSSATCTIIPGSWHHYAGVASATSTKFYVDGVLIFSGPGVSGSILNNSGSVIHIGKDVRHNTGRFGNLTLDEVRIWNRALCAEELQNNLNCELNFAGQTQLKGLYHLNQGLVNANNAGVNTAIDASGLVKTGTLNNFALNGANSNWTTGTIDANTVCAPYVPATAPINGTLNVCIGNTTTLTNANVGVWSSSNTAIATVNASGVVTGVANGTATISFTTECGGVSTANVTVNAPPVVTANHAGFGCVNDQIELFSSPSASYSWTGPNGFTSTQQNPIIPNSTMANAGTYTVTVTNANGCSASASTTVVVKTLPVITAGSNSPVCVGTTLNLTANGGVDYFWTGPNGYIANNTQNPSITNVTLAAAGTYTVKGAGANGCNSETTVNVVVNSSTPFSINSNGSNKCEGQTFNVGASVAGQTYSWTGPNGFTSNLQNISITNVSAINAGLYSVVLTNANGCTSTGAENLIVNALPTATITAGGPTTFCPGGSVTLTASAGTSYLWSNGATTQAITTSVAGSYTVTVTNASNCSATSAPTVVTVQDNVTPVAPVLAPITAECSATVPTPTTTDNCAGTIAGTTSDPLTYNTQGSYIVHWTFNDGNGNSTSVNQTVTILDVTPPSIVCPANISVSATSPLGAVVTFAAPVGTDNCPGASTSQTAGLASGATFPIGTTTVTYTVTDVAGHVVSCSFDVTVTCVPPVVTISADGPTTFCPGSSVTLTASAGTSYSWSNGANTQSITVNGSGSYSVTVSNGACSSTSAATVVTVQDNVAPVAPVLAPITAECSATVPVPTTNDNCAGTITGTTSDPLTYNTQGSYIVHWTFNDGNGNSTTVNQTVTILDVTPPSIACPANISVSATSPLGAVVTFAAPVGTDNCPGASTSQTAGLASGATFPIGTTTVTYTVTDVAGHVVSCSFDVTVTCVPPVVTISSDGPTTFCPGSSVTLTASAGTSYSWSNGANTQSITVNASGTYSVTVSNGACSATSASTVVTVQDNVAPVAPVLAPITAECSATVPVPTTTDNCAGTITGTTSDPLTYNTQGSYIVHWTFNDGNGNSTSVNQTVTILDVTPPSIVCPANISVSATSPLGAVVTFAAPVGTDNCPGASTSQTAGLASGATFPIGTTTVTYTVTDVAGHVVSCSFDVTVTCVPPVVTISSDGPTTFCPGSSVTLTASAGTSYSWSNGANTQSITVNASGTYSVTVSNGACSATSAATVVTVQDNVAPVAPVLAPITAECSATVPVPTTTDNCAGTITGTTSDPLTYNIQGSYIVHWTFNDGNGNTTTVNQTVTILDVTPPTISCPANISVSATSPLGAVVTFVAPVGTDNCPGASTSQTAGLASGATFPIGTTTVTYTVTDAVGHVVSCSFDVTVTCVPPVATITAGGPTAFCAGGSVTLTASVAASYSWSNGASTQSITVSAPGSYTVTVSNGACSATSNPTVVTVNPLPTPTITASGTTTICSGGSVTLTASAGSSYAWSNGATTQAITTGVAGSYTVIVTNASGCSATSAATVVTVNPSLTVSASSNAPVCSGGSLTLNATGTAASYSWSGPNGFTSNLQNNTINNVAVAATGTYTVTGSTAGCPSVTSTISIIVGLTPDIPVVSAPVIICAGSTATITATSNNGTIVWYNAPTGGSIVGIGSPLTITPGSTTTYYAEGAANSGGGVIVNSLSDIANQAVEINAQTGDDKGGIAVTQNSVYVNGDGGVGKFDHNLNIQAGLLPQRDGIFCDINPSTTGQLWTLWNTNTNSSPGSPFTSNVGNGIVNSIRMMDANLNLGTTIMLSTAITLTNTPNSCCQITAPGIFSGSGYVLLYSQVTMGWYRVDLSNGNVTSLGIGNGAGLNAVQTENWARWGWAEFNGTNYFAVYSENGTHSIKKLNVSTGAVTLLKQYSNLSDMANIVYSPWDNKVYMHHEGTAQFRSGDESLENVNGTSTNGGGVACVSTARTSVTVTVVDLPIATISADGPTAVCPGTTVVLNANTGSGFTYQWYNNGSPINAATNSSYGATISGVYTVKITNSNGCVSAASNSISVSIQDGVPPVTPVLADVTGECSATATVATTTDACAGIITGTTNDPLTFNTQGVHVIHWTFTDPSGNSSNANQNVIIQDVTPPSITCPQPIIVPASILGNAYGANVTYAATATDNCGNVTVTYSLASGSLFTPGTTQVTATANDGNGNTATCTFDVTVIAPEINIVGNGLNIVKGDLTPQGADDTHFGSTFPGTPITKTFTIQNTGNDNLNVSSINISGVDAANFTVSTPTGFVIEPGLSVTFDVSFLANTPGIKNATVTVGNDDYDEASYDFAISAEISCSDPVFTTAPASTTVSTDAGLCSAVVNYTTVIGGIPAPAVTYTFSGATTGTGNGTGSGAAFNKGVTTVTITATNPCNTVSTSFDITVVDNEFPVILNTPANIVQSNDANQCSAIVNWALPTATDNCPGVTLTSSHQPGDVFSVGVPTTVVYTATDAEGHVTTTSFTVNVNDTQAPNVICQNITVALDASGYVSITAFDINNGSNDYCGPVTLSFANFGTLRTFDCSNLGNNTVTLLVTDASGNTATCTANVTVVDNIPPSIICPANQTVTATSASGAVVTYATPVGNDNCAGATVSLTGGLASGSTFPIGSTLVTYTVVDAAGLTATCSFTVVVNCIPPTFTTFPSNQTVSNTTGLCSGVSTYSVIAAGIPSADISYSFSGATTGAGTGTGSGSTFNVGVTAVTVTATSSCGTVSATFNVTVNDTEAPTVSAPANVTVNVDANSCAATGVALGTAVYNDNCAATVTNNAPSSFAIGNTTVTWTAIDAAGNSSASTQIVTVVDNILPTIICPANQTVTATSASGAVVTYATPVGTDNCAGATVALTGGLASGSTFPIGSTLVTYTVTDAAGLTATCSFTVVVDCVPPTFTSFPTNQSVPNTINVCGAVVNYTVTSAGIPAAGLSYSFSGATTGSGVGTGSGATFGIGVTTVTVTATSTCGTISRSFNITVNDTQAPALSAPANVTVNVNANSCAATGVNLGNAVYSDNCAATVSNNAPVSFPLGSTIVTWTAVDAAGNTTTKTQTVTVLDNIKPTVVCPAPQVVNLNANCNASLPDFRGLLAVNDNCTAIGSLVITQSPAAGTTLNGTGTQVINFTVTDASGNFNNCSLTITKVDVTPPTITCPQPITVSNALNQCGAVVTYSLPTTLDNCAGGASSGVHVLNVGQQFFDYANNVMEAQNSPGLPLTFNPTDGQKMAVFLVNGGSTHFMYQNITLPSSGPIQLGFDLQYKNHYSSFSASQFIAVEIRNATTGAILQTLFKTNAGDLLTKPMTHYSYDVSAFAGQTIRLQILDATINNYYLDVLLDNVTLPGSSLINGSFETGDYTGWSIGSATSIYGTFGIGSGAGVSLTQTAGLPSGSFFPVGTTTNTFVATDLSGNTSTCSFTITVNDTQKPTTPVLANVTGQCSASAPIPTTTDNCSGTVSGTTTDPLTYTTQGTHVIHWTFTDAAGNFTTVNQNVVITDVTKPIITCPSTITVSATTIGNAYGANVTYTATATDNCSIPTISYAPASGSFFTPGTHQVTATANDGNGNTQSCTFNVIVIAPEINITGNGLNIVDGDVTPDLADNTNFGSTLPGNPIVRTFTIQNTGNDILNISTINIGGINAANFTVSNLTGTTVAPGGSVTFDVTFNAATVGFKFATVTVNNDDFDEAAYNFDITAEISCSDPVFTTAPASTTVSTDAGLCSAVVNYTTVIGGIPAPAVTYTFSGATTGTGNGTGSGTAFNKGVTTVTITATNPCNTVSTSFDITVVDNEFPVIVNTPANIVKSNDANQCSAVVNWTLPTATDNCPGVTLTSSHQPGDIFPVGTTTVVYTATDAVGHVVTTSFTVKVNDTQAPNVICQNITVALDANGQASITPADIDNGSNDNCGPVTLAFQNSGTICGTVNEGYNLTMTAPPGTVFTSITFASYGTPNGTCGNFTIGSCHASNSITKVEAYALGNNSFTIPATNGIFGDPCGGTYKRLYVQATYSSGSNTVTNFNCSKLGNNAVTLLVTDASGNTATCTANVTVVDNILPAIICPANVTVNCQSSTAPGGSNGTATATDNCSIASITSSDVSTQDPNANNAGHYNYTITRTWKATDGSGNFTTCDQIITVQDITKPIITVPYNIAVNCQDNNSSANTGVATATDNCSPVTITQTEVSTQDADANNVGHYNYTITRTWTATDVSGNTVSANQIINVLDVVAPVITCPADVTLNCQDATTTGGSNGTATATDNCSPVTITSSDVSTQSVFVNSPAHYNYTITRTWVATDVSGNSSSCVQTITVQDITAPVITCPASITLNCQDATAPGEGSNGTATASDNCSPVAITFSDASTQDANVNSAAHYNYTITRTWTATDISGNTSTCVQTITVQDITAPVITCPANIVLNCQDATAAGGANGSATATDNCGPITITSTDVSTQNADANNAGHYNYTITRTWKATDASGNNTTCEQTITVQDVTAPVLTGSLPGDANGQCVVNATVAPSDASIAALYSDNCSPVSATLASTTTAGDNCAGWIRTYTYTVTDVTGNTVTATVVYTGKDNTPPVINNVPANINIQCPGEVPVAPVLTATDNCSAAVVTYAEVRTNGININNFTLTRTWTAVDACGNTTVNTQVIVVRDNIAPVPTVLTLPTVSGQCSAGLINAPRDSDDDDDHEGSDGDDDDDHEGSDGDDDDDYGSRSHSYSTSTSYSSSHDGDDDDDHGDGDDDDDHGDGDDDDDHEGSDGDDDDDHHHDGDGCSIHFTPPTAMDNCKGLIVGTTTDPLYYTTQGTHIINWKFDDGNGNITIQQQIIIVDDNIAPVPTVTVLPTITGQCSVTVCATSSSSDGDDDDDHGDGDDDDDYGSRSHSYSTNSVSYSSSHDGDDDDDHGDGDDDDDHGDGDDDDDHVSTSNCIKVPTAKDNCKGTIKATTTSPLSYTTPGTYVIVWTYNDGNGNITTQNQTVIVKDVTAPVPVTKYLPTITGNCSVTVTTIPKANDNCVGQVTATTTSPLSYSIPGTYTIVWNYTDGRGNNSTQNQTVIVKDDVKPVITDVADKVVGCGASTLPAATGTATATDNCSSAIVTYTDVVSGNKITRTWKATDAKGNYATSTQLITVGTPFNVSLSSTPTNNTYTGGVSTNLYLGYGAQSTTLKTSTLAASGAPYTYVWTGSNLSSTTSATPVFTPTTSGNYTFGVTVTNNQGCKATATISICVSDIRVLSSNGTKVYMCHTTTGKYGKSTTIEVLVSKVASHLGSKTCGSDGKDKLGVCGQPACAVGTATSSEPIVSTGTAKDESSSLVKVSAVATTEEALKVTVMPNPSTTYFTLKLESKYQTPVEMRIMDGNGRVVDARSKLGANSTFQIGHNYSSGTYYAELIQGTQRKVVQLIKARG